MSRRQPTPWTDEQLNVLRLFIRAPLKAAMLRVLAKQWDRAEASVQTRLQNLRIEAGAKMRNRRTAPAPKHTPRMVRRPCLGPNCSGLRFFEYDRAADGPRFQCNSCARSSPSRYAPGGMGSVGVQIMARRYS